MRKSTQTQLAKWGGSLAVRIPKPLLEAAHMREGDTVSLGVKGGAIVLQSVAAKPTLAQLVNAITPENRHGETDWGALEGNETW